MTRITAWRYSCVEFHSNYDNILISFSTFKDNYATQYGCLSEWSSYCRNYMCNIIGNSQYSDTLGCIFVNGHLTLENCTILGPYGNGSVFTANFGSRMSMYITNCNIDVLSTFQVTPALNNVKYTSSLNLLSHLSTYQCNAIIPLKSTFKGPKKLESENYSNSFSLILSLYDCIYQASDL